MKKKNQKSKTVKAAVAPAVTVQPERKLNPLREALKILSAQVKPLIESGEFKSVNSAIIQTIYKNETHQFFKTFEEWKSEGRTIRKGEKSFCIWGKPMNGKKGEETYEFFPVIHMFSNAQVISSAKQ